MGPYTRAARERAGSKGKTKAHGGGDTRAKSAQIKTLKLKRERLSEAASAKLERAAKRLARDKPYLAALQGKASPAASPPARTPAPGKRANDRARARNERRTNQLDATGGKRETSDARGNKTEPEDDSANDEDDEQSGGDSSDDGEDSNPDDDGEGDDNDGSEDDNPSSDSEEESFSGDSEDDSSSDDDAGGDDSDDPDGYSSGSSDDDKAPKSRRSKELAAIRRVRQKIPTMNIAGDAVFMGEPHEWSNFVQQLDATVTALDVKLGRQRLSSAARHPERCKEKKIAQLLYLLLNKLIPVGSTARDMLVTGATDGRSTTRGDRALIALKDFYQNSDTANAMAILSDISEITLTEFTAVGITHAVKRMKELNRTLKTIGSTPVPEAQLAMQLLKSPPPELVPHLPVIINSYPKGTSLDVMQTNLLSKTRQLSLISGPVVRKAMSVKGSCALCGSHDCGGQEGDTSKCAFGVCHKCRGRVQPPHRHQTCTHPFCVDCGRSGHNKGDASCTKAPRAGNPRKETCAYCKNTGHRESDCIYKRRDLKAGRTAPQKCTHCGRFGHLESTCRKKESQAKAANAVLTEGEDKEHDDIAPIWMVSRIDVAEGYLHRHVPWNRNSAIALTDQHEWQNLTYHWQFADDDDDRDDEGADYDMHEDVEPDDAVPVWTTTKAAIEADTFGSGDSQVKRRKTLKVWGIDTCAAVSLTTYPEDIQASNPIPKKIKLQGVGGYDTTSSFGIANVRIAGRNVYVPMYLVEGRSSPLRLLAWKDVAEQSESLMLDLKNGFMLFDGDKQKLAKRDGQVVLVNTTTVVSHRDKEGVIHTSDTPRMHYNQDVVVHTSDATMDHLRYNHAPRRQLSAITGRNYRADDHVDCHSCILAAMKRSPLATAPNTMMPFASETPFEAISLDAASVSQTAVDGEKLFVLQVDSASKLWMYYGCAVKPQTTDTLNQSKRTAAELGFEIRRLKLDGDGTHHSALIESFGRDNNIEIRYSTPHTPQQNGAAERAIQTLANGVRKLLFTARLPPSYWNLAAQYFTYVRNRMRLGPAGALQAPIDVVTGKTNTPITPPVFGCDAIIFDHRLGRTKLDPKGRKAMFLGIHTSQYGYVFQTEDTGRRITTKDFRLLERSFAFIPSVRTQHGDLSDIITLSSLSLASHNEQQPDGPEETTNNTTQTRAETSTKDEQNYTTQTRAETSTKDERNNTTQTRAETSTKDEQNNTTQTRAETSTKDEQNNTTQTRAETTTRDEQNNTAQQKRENPSPHDEPDNSAEKRTTKPDGPDLTGHAPRISSIPKSFFRMPRQAKAYTITVESLLDSGGDIDPLIPANVREALADPRWKEQMDALVNKHNGRTWKVVEDKDVPPNARRFGMLWKYKVKRDAQNRPVRFKVRLCALGNQMVKGVHYDQTHAPTVSYPTFRWALSYAVKHDMTISQGDVTMAFNQSLADKELYCHAPPGYGRYTVKLMMNLEGTPQGARLFYLDARTLMKDLGFDTFQKDQGLFLNKTTGALILLWVDDFLIIAEGNQHEAIHKAIAERYDIVSDMSPSKILGMNIRIDNGRIKIDSEQYISTILDSLGMTECNPRRLPVSPGQISAHDESALLDDQHEFRAVVGTLQHLVNTTRPDIAYVTGALARRNGKATSHTMNIAKGVLRYLSGTKSLGIIYSKPKDEEWRLEAFSDSDYAGDSDNSVERRSTSGWLVLHGSSIVAWRSQLQKVTAQSTSEAELIAANAGARDLMYFRDLTCFVTGSDSPASPLRVDNIGAIAFAEGRGNFSRVKHIAIRYFYIKELIDAEEVEVNHVASKEQLADILTKTVTLPIFEHLVQILMSAEVM